MVLGIFSSCLSASMKFHARALSVSLVDRGLGELIKESERRQEWGLSISA